MKWEYIYFYEIVIFIFFGQKLVSGMSGSYGSSTYSFKKIPPYMYLMEQYNLC
jgi:hypothetical protein